MLHWFAGASEASFVLLLLVVVATSPRPGNPTPASGYTANYCPTYCQCSRIEAVGPEEGSEAGRRDWSMAQCWLPGQTVRLSCDPDWRILHLHRLEAVEEGEEATAQLLAACNGVERLVLGRKIGLTHLPVSLLRPLVRLTRISVELAGLTRLVTGQWAPLVRLRLLRVTDSRRLTRLEPATFRDCPQGLADVWFSRTRITGHLPDDAFVNCTNLHRLHLPHNRLTGLGCASLRGLGRLRQLDLSGNRLNGDLADCLCGASSPATDSADSALWHTPLLERLDVSNNQLTRIGRSAWLGRAGRLASLDLSRNRLVWLARSAFAGLVSLRRLRLEDNQRLFSLDTLDQLSLALYTLTTGETNAPAQLVSLSLPDPARTGHVLDVCRDAQISQHQLPMTLTTVLQQVRCTACKTSRYRLTEKCTNKSTPPVLLTKEMSRNAPLVHEPDKLPPQRQTKEHPKTPRENSNSLIYQLGRRLILVFSLLVIFLLVLGVCFIFFILAHFQRSPRGKKPPSAQTPRPGLTLKMYPDASKIIATAGYAGTACSGLVCALMPIILTGPNATFSDRPRRMHEGEYSETHYPPGRDEMKTGLEEDRYSSCSSETAQSGPNEQGVRMKPEISDVMAPSLFKATSSAHMYTETKSDMPSETLV